MSVIKYLYFERIQRKAQATIKSILKEKEQPQLPWDRKQKEKNDGK